MRRPVVMHDMGDLTRHRRHRSPGRGGRWFLIPVTSLVVAAAIGSSAMIVRYGPEDEPVLTARSSTPQSGTPAGVAGVDAMDTSDGAGSSGAEYGVAVLDRDTGRLSLGDEGSTPFYSASVVKLFTVVDILHRTETQEVTLSADQKTDIHQALTASDDNAMNALWSPFGGPATVTGMTALAGLQDTQPPAQAGQWGETQVSARDVVAVYQYALTSLTAQDRDTVMTDLAAATDTGADGFDQGFGLLQSPRPGDVAAKQGWMVDGSSMYLHSTGVAGSDDRYVIAVLSKQTAAAGYDTGRANVSSATSKLTGSLDLAA